VFAWLVHQVAEVAAAAVAVVVVAVVVVAVAVVVEVVEVALTVEVVQEASPLVKHHFVILENLGIIEMEYLITFIVIQTCVK
jgi:hypothetical protein